MAGVSFNISCKELKIAQIAQVNLSTLEFCSYIRPLLLWVNAYASEENVNKLTSVKIRPSITSNRYNFASPLCVQTHSRRRMHNCISWPGFWGICCCRSLKLNFIGYMVHSSSLYLLSGLQFTQLFHIYVLKKPQGIMGYSQLEHSSKWSDRNPHFKLKLKIFLKFCICTVCCPVSGHFSLTLQ